VRDNAMLALYRRARHGVVLVYTAQLLLLLLTLLYSVVCVTRRRVGRCMILSL